MRRFTLAGGWLVAVVLAITVTWQIVSAADDQVSDRPIAPLNVAAPIVANPQATTTSTIVSASTATSSQGAPSATDSTTNSTGALAPPTAEADWQTRSVETTGGNVLLRYRPGEVTYQSATPAPGYQVEVEKQGPPQVKVEFESASHKVEIEAAWEDGDLKVSVSEEDEE